MADDDRTTLGELSWGTVFRTEDGRLWVRLARAGGDLHECQSLAPDRHRVSFPAGRVVESLDLPALLAELDELRTLTHDLLIDRDASVGREVGRGEALAAVEAEAASLEAEAETLQGRLLRERYQEEAEDLRRMADRLRALGPVRPLPPPERVAERCRALEGALRDLAGAVSRLFQNPAQTFAGVATAGELLDAREAALGLLTEHSAGE